MMMSATARCLLALCAATAAACAPDTPRVTASITEIKRSNFDFIPEHWQEDYLEKLSKAESFRTLKAETQFEHIIKLCDWTHRQWDHSLPKPWPLDNAVDILRDVRSGKTGGWCGQFVYAFVDVLKSMGYFSARYLELSTPSKQTHYSAEVWSDEHRKWVAFDPDFNLYMRKSRTKEPASALEVRDSLYGGEPTEAVVFGGGPITILGRIYTQEKYKAWYHNVAVSMRADLMRHRRMVPTHERHHTHLYFVDDNLRPPKGKILFHNTTRRREDIEYDCNTVRVEHEARPGVVDLYFFTDGSMYNFKRFDVAYDDAEKWTPTPHHLTIKESSGVKRLRVVPVNQLEIAGVVTEVEIDW